MWIGDRFQGITCIVLGEKICVSILGSHESELNIYNANYTLLQQSKCDIAWNTGSAGTLYTLISPLCLRALVRCDIVRCQGILV